EFKKDVVDNFVSEYFAGRTPNPCTRCNFFIRFGTMYKKIKKLVNKDCRAEVVKIATGHYAQVVKKKDRYMLKAGKDKQKDQSYMLYHLTQEQLKNFITPLGKLTKSKVRKLAKKFNLSPADRADSQDACFVGDNYKSFIANYSAKNIKSGNFVDSKGKILGQHKGIPFYTIGQRRGLGISAAHPLYVTKIKKDTNEIILGSVNELNRSNLSAANVHWINTAPDKLSCIECKIRYNSSKFKADLELLKDNKIKVYFKKPQIAVTPGQNVVFYQKDIVLGGGVIE
ncbi:MAG: tRNA 2-thiouridine(34) synthase MnmA, partial [Candidatus Margulisbacteria bacterium]|nr:tRNA 2-thiouridine(34) synthase MnmA [Candidatus Margulisiibacteriota bacterium]